MTKALRKAIMTRSSLKNVYLKIENTTNGNKFKYQQNFCTSLLGKKKQNLIISVTLIFMLTIKNHKKFWEKSSLFFQIKA